jgi:chaperonin cofactor prefoldin
MKQDPYWFFKKWGIHPTESLLSKVEELENRVKVLEEENIGLTNAIYEMENSLDARIDILAEHLGVNPDV